jgi:DNA-binding MarR family transcriptional regulator
MNQTLTGKMHLLIAIMDGEADRLLRQFFDISYSSFHLLVSLLGAQPLSQRELADCMGHSEPAISRQIPKLAALGLIEVKVSPEHKRRNVITLTAKGQTMTAAANTMFEAAFGSVLADAKIDVSQLELMTTQIIDTLRSYDS